MDIGTFQQMRKALVEIVRHLRRERLTPFLYGSFAICLYANKPLIEANDIDLAFNSRREHDQAVHLLEEVHRFIRINQSEWESEAGEESVNTKLSSPDGVEFDLSYTRGDIKLVLDPERVIIVEDVTVPILSLDDLKKSYQRFSGEKAGAAQKIELIESFKHKINQPNDNQE